MISFQFGGDVVDAAAEEMMAGEAEGVEFGRERVGVGEVAFPRARTRSARPPRRLGSSFR